MEVKLNDEALQTALQAAVLSAIGSVGRDAIIKHVVTELSRTTDSYGRKGGPLWDIIRSEGDRIARTILAKKLEEDVEFVKLLESIYTDGVRRFMGDSDSREKMIQNVADGIRKAVTGDRY